MFKKIAKCEGWPGHMTQEDYDRLIEEGDKALERINRSVKNAARIELFKRKARHLFGNK